MKYVEMTWGMMEAVVNKLGGMDAVERFLRDELVVKAAERVFAVWKTVRLGVHKTPEAYEQALKEKGFRISDWAWQILKKITVSETVVEVDLGVLTVAEVGFKSATRYDAICKRIIEIGGQLCPNEVGPVLREQYPDQPYGEWDVIAMEPLADSDGGPSVFGVDHGSDGRRLYANYGDPGRLFGPDDRVVFVVPRK